MRVLKNETYLIIAGIAVIAIISVVAVVLLIVLDKNVTDDASVAEDSDTPEYAVSADIQEYAEVCGDFQQLTFNLFSRSDITYGDVVDEWGDALRNYVTAYPSDQLQEFHENLVERNKEILRLLEQEDRDSVLSGEDDWFNGFVTYSIEYGEQFQQIFDELPEDVQQQLEDAGCV